MDSASTFSSPKTRVSLSTRVRERVQHTFLTSEAGQKLPSERQLARELGVSAITVSRVLQEMQNEGVLERIPGKGTFVTGDVPKDSANSAGIHLETKRQGISKPTGRRAQKSSELGEINENPVIDRAVRSVSSQSESEYVQSQTELPTLAQPPVTWVIVDLDQLEVPTTGGRWPYHIISSIERAIQRLGGRTFVCNRHEFELERIGLETQKRLNDGINSVIYVGDSIVSNGEAWMRQLFRLAHHSDQNQHVNVVLVQFASDNAGPFDVVRFDGEWGSYLAALHLIKKGHRELLFLAPTEMPSWISERLRGFRRALSHVNDNIQFGAQDGSDLLQSPQIPGRNPHHWLEIGADIADVFLGDERRERITGIVAANDELAIGFINRVREADPVLAKRLAITGFDDIIEAQTEGLTTIHPPVEVMGEQAANLVARRLSQSSPIERTQIVLKPVLIERASTYSNLNE